MSNIGRFSMVPSRILLDTRLVGKTDVYIFLAICSFTSKEGNNWCWPSTNTISHLTGISKSNVIKSIKRLIEYGYLLKEARFRPNKSHTSNMYKVLMDNELPEEHRRDIRPSKGGCYSSKVGCYPQHQEGVTHNTPINTTNEYYKKEEEKIILQEGVDNFKQRSETLSSSQASLDNSLQRVNNARGDYAISNKISSDYKPTIEKESKIKTMHKCSNNAYELALKEFILYYEAKGIESPNWDNLFEKWCLNRTQWREKPILSPNVSVPATSPAEVVQNNIKRRLSETERNVFSYIASIITPEEYILHGFLLLKLDDLKGNYGVFSHISRDICSLLSANYMDKLKMSLQAFMPEIQEVRLVAKA